MQYGEIVQLGRHKLMCGDATRREDVLKLVGSERVNLVLTDPPWGIDVQNNKTNKSDGKIGAGSKEYPVCIGDVSTAMARENYLITRLITNCQIIFGGQNFTDFLPPSCGWLFWDKCRSEGLSFSDGELAWSNCTTKIKKYSHKWNGYSRAGSKELNEKTHPMQKPVELFMKILEDFSKPDDLILDCFAGSGTTLIACEQTGRRCLTMEISPQYCDVICERYEKLKSKGGGAQICIPGTE